MIQWCSLSDTLGIDISFIALEIKMPIFMSRVEILDRFESEDGYGSGSEGGFGDGCE